MKYFKSIFLLVISLSIVGCAEEEKVYSTFDQPDWKVDLNGYVDAPVWTVDQFDNLEKPIWKIDMDQNQPMPSYTLPDANIMPSSMTAVLQLTPFLETYLGEDDKMLAFIGNECRGEGVLKIVEGKKLFYVMIKAPATETGKVSFLYYNQKNRAAYQTGADVAFEIDGVYGNIESPVLPDFEKDGKYPKQMKATLKLPDILPGVWSKEDVVAAFVGNECRGVGMLMEDGSYVMEIRGSKADAEKIRFKYYNASNKNIYKSRETYSFVNQGALGTENAPVMFELVPQTNMTAVVRLSDELRVFENTETDQVAAFVGEECRAIGSLKTENGNAYYIMQIKGNASADEKISFQYYSANNKYLYHTDAYLSFSADGTYGSNVNPETLPIDMDGKYPLKMTAYLTLPTHLLPYVQNNDQIAAFIGGECRGTTGVEMKDGSPIFRLNVIGKIGVEESWVIRYYNSRNRYLYETSTYYDFKHQTQLGTEEEPLCLTLINVE